MGGTCNSHLVQLPVCLFCIFQCIISVFVCMHVSVLRRTTNSACKSIASASIHVLAKLGGVANIPDSCAVIQRDLNCLEKWSNKNLTKFNKGKCQILQLGTNDPMHRYTLGASQLESTLDDLLRSLAAQTIL